MEERFTMVSLLGIICWSLGVLRVMAVSTSEPESIHEVEAVVGGMAKLPCDIDPIIPGDQINLVIWFRERDDKRMPIYSLDSRDKASETPKRWVDRQLLGEGRALFRMQDRPAKLTLDNVSDNDAGSYYCRVDFRQSPTRNIKVILNIIVPPEQLSVLDESGHHIPDYVIGPYNEGSSINITCVATGGRPLPKVTWWQENALLDDSFDFLAERRVKNILHLEKIERKHLGAVFTCQASNNNLVAPIFSAVTLDINLRPLWVKLIGENRPLSAGITYELSCEVVGSRPKPIITWWKGSTQMKNTRETTSPDGNTTTSVLTFVPTVEDGGKYLSCRGQQPQISDSGIEDGWKLDIHHVPLVTLELGSTLNGSTIKEGVDVYFECNIKSNPWVYKVSWRHNGKQLYNNIQAGTIVSNQSLVLQSITTARSGYYTCVGHNQEGDGESNPVQLDVKYSPVCRPGQPKVFGVARNEIAKIACELEGNPTEMEFTWKFNNTGDIFDISQKQVYSEKARSVVTYTPMTEADYGTLLCWGSNEIGVQKEPCVFYINPAGKPDPLNNCTILNQTVESLYVECNEGFDGGLTQEFIMEVYDTQSRKLVSNVTSKIPMFTVTGLESGAGFDIGLYATNRKGKSRVSHLSAFTLKGAEKHTADLRIKPQPPENCSITQQTSSSLRVSCAVKSREPNTVYLMQVYDSNTRILIGTATSQDPASVQISTLPADHQDLLLFVRTMDENSRASDATVVYAPRINMLARVASTVPVLLQITPLLGAVIGVVAALILVAVIIVVVIRLRGGGDRDDKEYDDGGLSSAGRRCVAGNNSDKASTEPLNKDLNDSVDSLDEKNPDIIPQSNTEDEYQDEERAFERLNNMPTLRTYSRMQSPNSAMKNGSFTKMNAAEITYAELSLANQQIPPHLIYNQQAIPMNVIRRPEPTVYAQLDMTRIPPNCQPLSPPHPGAAFHTLNHPHLPAYLTRPLRDESLQDGSISSETPLLATRESNATIQSLKEMNNSRNTSGVTSSIASATLPRPVNATRF